MTARVEASTVITKMDLGQTPKWTLDEYRSESAGVMNVKRFDAVAVYGKSLVVHEGSRFERDAGLGKWKNRWTLVNIWRVAIPVLTRFADIRFVFCEQESSYCLRL